MDNRHGLVAAPVLTLAGGTAEREAAMAMLETLPLRRMTVGGISIMASGNCPVSEAAGGGAPCGPKTPGLGPGRAHHPSYHLCCQPRLRKLVEQIFGWTKTVGLLRKTRHRGRERLAWVWTFTLAALQPGADAELADPRRLLRGKHAQICPKGPEQMHQKQAGHKFPRVTGWPPSS